MTLATLVEVQQMLETVAASLLAGVGVTFAFSLTIWGTGRFVELNREERPLAAASAAAVAVLALTGVAAAIVFGIVVMTSK